MQIEGTVRGAHEVVANLYTALIEAVECEADYVCFKEISAYDHRAKSSKRGFAVLRRLAALQPEVEEVTGG
ncbi:hypothetical protein [Oceanimonas doudoroffii]|uniref:hypothetical protein n=1 Tax=Oceanimonas doudoroffii TaxID=84158 RepID=UPI00113FE8B4|nr:hypothetical protein [Oceanimonas doudoroffii]